MDRYTVEFNKINNEANKLIMNLMAISLTAGGAILFVARFIFLKADFWNVFFQSLFLVLLGLSTIIIKKLKMDQDLLTFLLGFILILAYLYLFNLRIDYAFVTVWTAIFVFMSIGLIYINRTILYMQFASATLVMIYSFVYIPEMAVTIDPSDHFARYAIIILVFLIAIYANQLFRNRLLDNMNQLKEIVEQKESLTQLYEEVQASEEELAEQNLRLRNSYDTIDRLAYYDSLTGLPNRNRLFNDIEIMETSGFQTKGGFSFVLTDLDNFKNINDLHTHEIGDKFLIHVARKFEAIVEKYGYKLYRVGSDDFVILTNYSVSPEPITTMLNDIMAVFQEAMIYEVYTIISSISIGISESRTSGDKPQILLRNADIALNVAKKMGKNNYVFFDKMIEKKLMRKLHLQEALKSVIENEELHLEYQPIMNIVTGNIEGFEALLRWNSSEYGSISPVEFIPYAEENMTIIPIGLWVLEEGIAFIREINERFESDYRIAINVSNVQLSNRAFLNELDILLKKHKVSTKLIDFEITESILIDSYEEAAILLSSLRELGISISLDDFGTGYSSLSYLQSLPIDNIKIDRSFIHKLNDKDNPLVDTIISMAHRMDLAIVAEGVETLEQLDVLNALKCNFVQGYYFSKPLPEDDIIEYLNKRL